MRSQQDKQADLRARARPRRLARKLAATGPSCWGRALFRRQERTINGHMARVKPETPVRLCTPASDKGAWRPARWRRAARPAEFESDRTQAERANLLSGPSGGGARDKQSPGAAALAAKGVDSGGATHALAQVALALPCGRTAAAVAPYQSFHLLPKKLVRGAASGRALPSAGDNWWPRCLGEAEKVSSFSVAATNVCRAI